MSRLIAPNSSGPAFAGPRPMLFGILALCLLLSSPAHAFTSVQLVPSDDFTDAFSSHEIRFTTEQSFGNGARIELSYPAGFDLGSASLGSTSGLGGGIQTLSVLGQTVTITRGGSASGAGAKTLVLDGVVNTSSSGNYQITLRHFAANDALLEGPDLSAVFLILDPPPDHLQLVPAQGSVNAGDELLLRLSALDVSDNPAAPGVDQSLDLFSSSPSGSFHASPGGPAISSSVLLADSTGLTLWYRDSSIASSPVDLTVLDVSGGDPSLGFAQTSATILAGPVNELTSSVSASSPVVADGVDTSLVELVLRDAFGNPVAGIDSASIVLSIPASDAAVDKLSAISGADGSFAARVRTLQAGAHPLSASVGGLGLTAQPTIQFQLRPVDGAQSTISGGPDVVADGSSSITVDLVLLDSAGRPVAGVDSAAIVLDVLDGPALLTKLDANSSMTGGFTAELRSTVAGDRRVSAQIAGVDLADTLSVSFLTGPVDPNQSRVVLDAPAVADGSDFITVGIVIRDAFDNPIAGLDSSQIVLSLANAAIEKTSASTGAGGSFVARLRSTSAGDRALSVRAAGILLADSPIASFLAGPADSARTTLLAGPTAVADGVDAVPLTLTLRDSFDNPVSGIDSSRISFVLDPNWQLSKLDDTSDASGVFRAELRSTTSGANPTRALLDGSLISAAQIVSFVAGPVSASRTSLSLDGAAFADGADPVLATLIVRDASDNPVAGLDSASIAFSIADVVVTKLNAVSGLDGSFLAELRSTVAGQRTLTVTADGVVLDDTPLAEFTVGAVDAARSILAAAPSVQVADGVQSIALDLTLRDAFDNPVAGVDSSRLQFDLPPAWQLAKLDAVSDAAGRSRAELRSSQASQANVVARLDGMALGSPVALEFTAGALDRFVLALPDGAVVTAGQAARLAVEAQDAQGNRVVGYGGTIQLASDSLGGGPNLSWSGGGAGSLVPQAPGEADYVFAPADSGRVEFLATNDFAESLSLEVADGATQNSIALQVVPATASQLDLLAGDAQSATVATTVAVALQVLVRDVFGNPVAAVDVDFATSGGGRIDTDLGTPGDQGRASTDASGIASCPIWELGTLAGLQSATASTGFGGNLIFSATALPGPVASLVLEPDGSQNLEVATSIVVAARAEDAFANPVPGLEVTLFVSDALDGNLAGVGETDSLGISQQRGDTGADGRVRVRYTAPDTAALTDLVDATAAGIPAAAVNDLVLQSVEGSAVALSLGLPVPALRAGSEGSFPIRLLDAHGNDAPGASATVELRANLVTGLEFSALSGGPYTNALDLALTGSQTVYYRGGPAGLHDFSATDAADLLSGDSGQLEIIADSSIAYFTLAYPASATAGASFTLAVEAFDAWDNLASDAVASLTFDVVDAADTTSAVSVALAIASGDLSGGRFETSLQSIQIAGDYALRLSHAGLGTVGSALRVDPAGAWELVATSPDSLRGIVAGDTVDLEIEARDSFGNPVPGESLNLLLLEGGSLDLAPTDTDALGRALYRLRSSSTMGTVRLRLGILDGDPVARETVLFVVESIPGAVASLSIELADTTMVAGDAVAVSVIGYDAGGNFVDSASDAVELVVRGSGAVLTPSSGNLLAGVFGSSVRDTLVGSFLVEASLSASPGIVAQSDSIRVSSAGAHHILALGATDFDAPSGARSLLSARVEDPYGNTVAGEWVRLALLDSPPGAAIEDPEAPIDDGLARSDAVGRLDFDLLLSPIAGNHQLSASILDANPQGLESVEWNVNGIPGASDHLVLSLPGSSLVAGVAQPLSLRLEDSANNLVDFDGEVALVFTPASAVTNPDPVLISAGIATVDLSAFQAGTLDIQANLVALPGVSGSLNSLEVLPNLAAGTIPVPLVDPNPNTANGLAVTRLQAGPVVDAWNNPVAAGSLVDLSADGGTWISEDMDPAQPGLQRITDANGFLDARLVAPISAGTVTVDLSSANAAGQATIEFLTPASLVLDGPLSPSAAIHGQPLSFSVFVRNVGGVDAHLNAALSEISVDDGQGVSFQAALASDFSVPAGSNTLLDFVTTALPIDFAPGSHRPTLSLNGLDAHAQPVSAFLVTPQASLQVGTLITRSVQHVLQAIVGDTVVVRVQVENIGAGDVEVVELALNSSPQGDFQFIDRDPLPIVSAGAQQSIASRWLVGPATSVGSYRFLARVTGRFGGTEFVAPEDSSASPLVVGTTSQLELVSGAISPNRIHHGAPLQLSVGVRNIGGTTVDLDPGLSVASMGGGLWSALLTGPVSLPPAGEGQLVFELVAVPAGLGSGALDLQLHLEGNEAGRPVVVDLVANAAVLVETPAAIALASAPLDPAIALRGASIPFRLSLDNAGEAEVSVDLLSTRLLLGEPAATRISVLLDSASDRSLTAGANELLFQSLALPLDLVLADPVGYVELRGTQNGEPFTLDLPLPVASLSIQDPAGLRILSTEALHPRAPSPEVNAGQRVPVRVVVDNAGGDAVDSLRVRLLGTALPPSSAPELLRPRLAAGESDTLFFDVDLSPSFGPESLRSEIVSALSALTGELLTPEPAIDDVTSLTIQRPVALDFLAEWVGSADPTVIQVSPGQVFELRVAMERVAPLDAQGDWLGVDFDLNNLGGFTLEPGSSNPTRLDTASPQAVLRLRAPPDPETTDLSVSLRRTDLDANDPAALPLQGSASLDLRAQVVGGVAFDLCELRILSPVGASDGVLSAGQNLVVEGELDGPANLQGRALELLLPNELALVGGSARQDLASGVTTVTWQLQCSATVAPGLLLRMVAHGLDVQSSAVLADTCSSLAADIVSAAEARAQLSILAPSTARDRGELAPGAIVEFGGGFALAGDAVALGPAQLRIELPAGFTLLDGTSEIQDLADPNQTVVWRAQGPSQIDLGVQTIRLHTESPALDENSGSPALGAGEIDAVALSILTDPLRLQLSDLDPGSNLISSDRIYERARLQVHNGHGEPSRLTVFELRVVDDTGADYNDPAVFLETLQLRRSDASGSWSVPAGANPIRFVLDSAVPADDSTEFLIGAQARDGAPGVSFAFRVEGSTADVVDPGDFPLSYTLLDAAGIGRSSVIVGASVTSSSDPEVATHSYPNPFVPSREEAVLTYHLAQESRVEIEIFDLLGERVQQWSFEAGEPQTSVGLHDGDVSWDGRNGRGETVRNGVYLCRFRAEGREIFFRIAVTR